MLDQLWDILLNGIIFGAISAVVAFFISPLQFLKIIRQQTGEPYLKIFYSTLKSAGFLAFFRGAIPYSAMNFLSSMAFGISEYCAEHIIGVASFSVFFAIVLRSTMGGITETLFSLYSELQEISRNKGDLMQSDAKTTTILLPILMRNTIFWYGSVITSEISIIFQLNLVVSSAFAFLLGILLAFASIPLDVIATQSCGAVKQKNVVSKFKEILNQSDKSIFAGTLIRVIQVGIFTIATVITMSFLAK